MEPVHNCLLAKEEVARLAVTGSKTDGVQLRNKVVCLDFYFFLSSFTLCHFNPKIATSRRSVATEDHHAVPLDQRVATTDDKLLNVRKKKSSC